VAALVQWNDLSKLLIFSALSRLVAFNLVRQWLFSVRLFLPILVTLQCLLSFPCSRPEFLHSDFGFSLLSDDKFGIRKNDLDECMPILEEFMPKEFFQELRITAAPKEFIDAVDKYNTNQF
jgi:hypothetical protein